MGLYYTWGEMTFCPVEAESRAFTDAALAELRSSGWQPSGWLRFLVRVSARSAEQVASHPRAATEVTALHAAFLCVAPHHRRARWWVGTSWAMAITHLGLLGARRSMGWPNAISLARANLPVTGRILGRWLGVAALVSDNLDGTLARRAGPTMFGFYADSLADAAFWTWFGGRRDPSRLVRGAALAAWAAPVIAVGAASIAKGEMVDSPHPLFLRPAAAMQAMVALRALRAVKQT
jgi:hypothetical protein